MEKYRLTHSGKRPTKLFVGGLHGDEGLYTAPILERLARDGLSVRGGTGAGVSIDIDIDTGTGESIIVPSLVEERKYRYIGVLFDEYYRSEAGTKLLQLIREHKPSFYFELHSYGRQSYSQLTDSERLKKIGVPPFVDLDDGILIGSIAPILRREFAASDFCMTIELPKWKIVSENEGECIKEKVLEVLRIGLTKADREEMMREFRIRYPAEVKMAEELFYRYYRNQLNPF
ncbi:MAG: DUF2119 family protein [Methanophagales archaeon]|nr:DUF2119 family protein [Methanophagales archaeon]